MFAAASGRRSIRSNSAADRLSGTSAARSGAAIARALCAPLSTVGSALKGLGWDA